jgi:tripartite-type tricarboxylate transporter receptor subunit TctC
LAVGEFGRPLVASPGTPAERVKILRDAYSKSMGDAELIAEASKGRMDMDPSTGQELQKLLKDVMDQPREVLERVKMILSD